MARLYYHPPRSNWAVGLPLWLAIPAALFYLTGALIVGAFMLCLFLLIEAGKGSQWLWRRWRTR